MKKVQVLPLNYGGVMSGMEAQSVAENKNTEVSYTLTSIKIQQLSKST